MLMTDSKIALLRRPQKGLLANLWEFPNVLGETHIENVADVLKKMGVEFSFVEPIGEAKHIFSHIEWQMTGFKVSVKKEISGFTWVTKEELRKKYSVPSAFSYFHKKI